MQLEAETQSCLFGELFRCGTGEGLGGGTLCGQRGGVGAGRPSEEPAFPSATTIIGVLPGAEFQGINTEHKKNY